MPNKVMTNDRLPAAVPLTSGLFQRYSDINKLFILLYGFYGLYIKREFLKGE